MINIDYSSNKAIYEQIYDEILRLIFTKVLNPDDKLPSVRELAAITKINPNTIQKAYKALENDNYIYTVKGKGNFIKEKDGLIDAHVKKLKDDLEELLKSFKELNLSNSEISAIVDEILNDIELEV